MDHPVLVIGRKGQVATDLVAAAASQKLPLVAFGRPVGDLANGSALETLFRQVKPRAVINAAAYTAVDKAEAEPAQAFALNRDGPHTLAHLCRKAGLPFIHLSTDQVFDGTEERAHTEDDLPNPLSVYGQSKWEGEQAVLEACPQALVVRVSWVFGPSGDNFVTKLLSWAKAKDRLSIVSDQRGCPTYSPSLAAALLTLLEIRASGILHLAGSEAMTRFEQAKAILEASRRMAGPFAQVEPVLTKDFPTPAQRPLNAILDSGRAKALYGLSLTAFAPALEATLDAILNA